MLVRKSLILYHRAHLSAEAMIASKTFWVRYTRFLRLSSMTLSLSPGSNLKTSVWHSGFGSLPQGRIFKTTVNNKPGQFRHSAHSETLSKIHLVSAFKTWKDLYYFQAGQLHSEPDILSSMLHRNCYIAHYPRLQHQLCIHIHHNLTKITKQAVSTRTSWDPPRRRLPVCQLQTCPWWVDSAILSGIPVRRSWSSKPWSYWPDCYLGIKSAWSLLSPPANTGHVVILQLERKGRGSRNPQDLVIHPWEECYFRNQIYNRLSKSLKRELLQMGNVTDHTKL